MSELIPLDYIPEGAAALLDYLTGIFERAPRVPAGHVNATSTVRYSLPGRALSVDTLARTLFGGGVEGSFAQRACTEVTESALAAARTARLECQCRLDGRCCNARSPSSRVRPVTVALDPPRSATVTVGASTASRALNESATATLAAVSLFSGIAGLDRGLEDSRSVHVVEMCEAWEPARRVLRARYPDTSIAPDVSDFVPSQRYQILTAGFPCTDLSHAGSKTGIFGPQSGLVEHVFRIADATRPEWIVLENVPNLLTLHKGAGISEVVTRLERLGYSWAYRTVDSRFTGVPQRRYRVIILASVLHDPATPLLSEDTVPLQDRVSPPRASSRGGKPAPLSDQPHGFYWTEGRNGLGLVEGAIPTLKGGSTLGLPSAPAIWFPTAPVGHRFVLPRVQDGERLQGMPVGWTTPAVVEGDRELRWKLLGNAVTRGVGSWIGDRIGAATTGSSNDIGRYVVGQVVRRGGRWPKAATGGPGREAMEVLASDHPRRLPMTPLEEIVDVMAAPPLSYRATRGFLSRLDEKERRIDARLYADLESHLANMRSKPAAPPETSWASSPAARTRMQAQKQHGTKPELRMRQELTALGLHYRLQVRPEEDLRSRLDIVFKGAKVAVDIRGCFWHSCTEHGTKPRPNADRWSEKLQRNRERDARIVADLTARGWVVVVVWEHDDPKLKAKEVAALVADRRPARRGESERRR